MSEAIKCPACGAGNPAGAPWCNQCFQALGVPDPPATPPVASSVTPTALTEEPEWHTAETDPDPADSVPAAELDGAGTEATWQCSVCEEVNPLSSNLCSLCQTPIFVSFGAVQEVEPSLSPRDAGLQAMFPGLAHIRLGHGLIGFTIALLVWVLIAFALILAFAGGAAAPVLLVFLTAIGIVVVSAYDAQQIASRRPDAVLLKPRILTFVALGAIALVVAIIWVQGLAGAARAQ